MMPTATKGKRPLRHLTATDKIIAIQRIHDGESKASVARDIGVPESTLRGWCKNEEKLRYMSQQAQDQKPSADKLMDKIVSEAAMAAAAAAELLSGPAEKRQKLDASALATSLGLNGKIKSEYHNKRNPLNGLDFSGGSHHSPLNGDAYAYSYNSFAKAASNLQAMQQGVNKAKDLKGYDLTTGKMSGGSGDHHDHHLGNKSDLSMAAISPLTSLSNLSGMGALGQSPLALSFNDIATNLNLLAQLQSNVPMSGFNSLASPQSSMRASTGMGRPKSNPNNNSYHNAACSPHSDIMDKPQSLTVKNLAKLQQKSPTSSMDMGMADGNNNSHKGKGGGKANNGMPGGASPSMDDPLWYWIKSQQAMNTLYNNLPRTSSPVPRPTNGSSNISSEQQVSPNPATTAASNAAIPTSQSKAMADFNLMSSMFAGANPGLSGASGAGGLDPKALTSSAWFWQWYKTFGATLMKNSGSNGSSAPSLPKSTSNADMNQNYPAPMDHKSNVAAYNNILFSQLTKNGEQDQQQQQQQHRLNRDATLKAEPEDLSHHHNQLFNDADEDEDGGGDRTMDHPVNMRMPTEHAAIENRHRVGGGMRTPSPNTVTPGKAAVPHIMDLMNSNARSLTPPQTDKQAIISAQDPVPMSSSSTSSTNSTTMLTEAHTSSPLNSPALAIDDKDETSTDSNGHGINNTSSSNNSKSPNKVRAVLDNFLYNNNSANNNNNNNNTNNLNNLNNNNNNNVANNLISTDNCEENAENINNNNIDIRNNNNVQIMSSLEAFEYGEKFLKWLESCSDPSITAMQVMQFRYLLQSVKSSANRAANANDNYCVATAQEYGGVDAGGEKRRGDMVAVGAAIEERTKVRRRK